MDTKPESFDESKPTKQGSLGWAKFLIVLIPLLFLVGYYSYDEVRASLTRIYSGAAALPSLATTTIGLTITPDNLAVGLVAHFTFDGQDMDWGSTTAEVGGLVMVATGPSFTCGTDTVLDADSNVYNTLQIGSQCWMKQNMRVGTRISVATNQTNNSTIEKYCYNNTDSICTSNNPNQPYGGLYQWDEAMQYSTTPGAQGICPTGWHIPTHDEFTTLERAICSTGSCATDFPYDTTTTGNRGITEGTKLKPNGSSSFELNLAGVGFSGSFFSGGSYGYLWSSSESGGNAWYRSVLLGDGRINRIADTKVAGLSVRCLQDTITTTSIRANAVNMKQSSVAIGKVGQALTFDKVDDYVNAGSHASLDDLGPLTISMWIKPRSFGEGDALGKLIGKDASPSTPGSWQVSLLNGSPCLGGGTPTQTASIFFGKVGSTGNARTIRCSADNSITLNQWQYITVTWDGSGEGNNAPGVRLYKNGSEMSYTTTNSAGPAPAGSDAALDLYIGNRLANDRTFDGQIDDVRLYNRVLSPAEVAQLYSLGSGSTIQICKEESVQDADGGTYNTIAIGSQCWLDRNMNVGTRIAAFTTQTNNSTIEKYCYSNNDANCTTNHPNKPDGGFYQWDEAMQYSTTAGARGICPAGFHIPTDEEWHELEKFLLDGGSTCIASRAYLGCAPAGTKLKPGGRSLFEGNLAGYRWSGSSFFRNDLGRWWTSSLIDGTLAWNRIVDASQEAVSRESADRTDGLSVRCLQD